MCNYRAKKNSLSYFKISKKPLRSIGETGFTLVEVLISIGIVLVLLPFAASTLTNSQLLGSFSKHKIQAAYAAQQIIETERQLGYTNGGSYNNFGLIQASQGTFPVALDSKGNFNNTNCNNNPNLFCGTATITVTQPSAAVDHVLVNISWNEKILNAQIPMSVSFAEDIANDPMLN